MSATNSTQYYNLPQFTDNDIPKWEDVNSAFEAIDTALHNIATASGITQEQAQTLINNSLVGAVFHDATNGHGITASQYGKLKIKS